MHIKITCLYNSYNAFFFFCLLIKLWNNNNFLFIYFFYQNCDIHSIFRYELIISFNY